MAKILAGHESDAKFVYEGGIIQDGAFSFELDIESLDKWDAVIKVHCTQDSAQKAMDLLNTAGYIELTICPYCVFAGDVELVNIAISGMVGEVVICEYRFKGMGKLDPPTDDK